MCGISGLWYRGGAPEDGEARLRAMTGALAHRGPDADGIWMDREVGVGLGHRRLSVLDLSEAGAQPMRSRTGRYVVVFNGELYNWQELRREEERSGAAWRGHSDTEVLLAMIERQGLATAIRRCAGMFALALWDRETRALALVRDRLGEKPLYYTVAGGVLLFGSELKALRSHPAWVGRLDQGKVGEFLQVGYVPGTESIYEGVAKVAPGTIVRLDLATSLAPEVETYWSGAEVAAAGLRSPLALSDESALELVSEALHRTIREEMVADVPVGAFLSGGIDSSLVVALMRAESSHPVRTFTVRFAEREYDEGGYAAEVARALQTEHHTITLDATAALSLVPDLPRIYDEPFADPSAIPTTLVARLARQHVTVALSGDGGDELFGGYWRHFFGPSLWGRIRRLPSFMRTGAAHALRTPPPDAWDRFFRWGSKLPFAGSRFHAPGDRIHKLASVLDVRSPEELYGRLLGYRPEGAHSSALPALTQGGLAERMMLADLVGYLPDDILVKTDRAAMSVSLEGRAPFLDHRVVELAWRLPLHQRIRGSEGKWPLRRLLARHLPASMFERPKMGFAVPLDAWLRGPLRPWVESLLTSTALKDVEGIDPVEARALWTTHLSGVTNRSRQLWPLLMFLGWRQATDA